LADNLEIRNTSDPVQISICKIQHRQQAILDSRQPLMFGTEAYSSTSKEKKKEVMKRRDGLTEV
jgi:hypothetical protein